MNLKRETINSVHQLAKDSRFDKFFQNMEKQILSDNEKELIEKLVKVLSNELEIDSEQEEKVRFFLLMGYWSKME